MILSSTFIPSQRVKDLLCHLYVEFGCWGETRPILIDLRVELGAADFARFQEDLFRLMQHRCAYSAVRTIISAAVARSNKEFTPTKIRETYQPA
jgi:hypothetical protein